MEKSPAKTMLYQMDFDSSDSLVKPAMPSPRPSKRPSLALLLRLLRGKRTRAERGINISTPTHFKHITHISYDEESGQFIVRLSLSSFLCDASRHCFLQY